jgi:hypothetical protein
VGRIRGHRRSGCRPLRHHRSARERSHHPGRTAGRNTPCLCTPPGRALHERIRISSDYGGPWGRQVPGGCRDARGCKEHSSSGRQAAGEAERSTIRQAAERLEAVLGIGRANEANGPHCPSLREPETIWVGSDCGVAVARVCSGPEVLLDCYHSLYPDPWAGRLLWRRFPEVGRRSGQDVREAVAN